MNDGGYREPGPGPKNIAIDFDDTFTADPDLWREFIRQAEARGHRVYIVTCRRDTEENRADVVEVVGDALPRYRLKFTALSAKDWFMRQHGIVIDIWVDDCPESVANGR